MKTEQAPTFPEWKKKELVWLTSGKRFATIAQLFGLAEADNAKALAAKTHHEDPSPWMVLE